MGRPHVEFVHGAHALERRGCPGREDVHPMHAAARNVHGVHRTGRGRSAGSAPGLSDALGGRQYAVTGRLIW
jgi:hypothetical protein